MLRSFEGHGQERPWRSKLPEEKVVSAQPQTLEMQIGMIDFLRRGMVFSGNSESLPTSLSTDANGNR
jgi:hypothetical protein